MDGFPEASLAEPRTPVGARDDAAQLAETAAYFRPEDIGAQIWRLIVEGTAEDEAYGDFGD